MKTDLLLFAGAIAVAACNTSTDPFALDHAQILAVRSEPAHAAPGSSVRIDVLAGDEAGDVFVAVPDGVDAGGLPAQRKADGWYVTAPAGAQSAPVANVTLAVDGVELGATKQLLFADDRPNPMIDNMQVDGSAVEAIAASKGTKPALDTAVAGDGTYTFAWYTSIGKLEHYRREQATLDANELGEGLVVVVVRDDQGGVTWQMLPANVQ
jgi:hypothetical protein